MSRAKGSAGYIVSDIRAQMTFPEIADEIGLPVTTTRRAFLTGMAKLQQSERGALHEVYELSKLLRSRCVQSGEWA